MERRLVINRNANTNHDNLRYSSPKDLNSLIFSPLCRWRGGWSVWVHKTHLEFQGENSVTDKFKTFEVTGRQLLKNVLKNTQKKHEMPAILLLWCHPSVRKPCCSDSTRDGFISTLFLNIRSSDILLVTAAVLGRTVVTWPQWTFTPKVFCGLKHFTYPSINIVVSR